VTHKNGFNNSHNNYNNFRLDNQIMLIYLQMSTFEAVSDTDMMIFLPEILDGLFTILGDNNPEIQKM